MGRLVGTGQVKTNNGEVGLVGYDVCLTRRRSRVRFSELVWKKYFFSTAVPSPTTTVAQRFGAAVARWAHNPKAPGSKPGIAIQREKKYFFVAANQLTARVAQSVEHWSNKPTVAGSIPVVSSTPLRQKKLFFIHRLKLLVGD